MIDTNSYKRLARRLNKTRKTLSEACQELNISIDDVDDYDLDQHIQECSHCGVWGDNHRQDEDNFPICRLCFDLVGR